jgi:RelE toxin of RelE / RelB toxin-antitoxin system
VCAPWAYSLLMQTVVESPIFQRLWPRYWDEDERADFASYLALNPEAGAVIRGSGGVRKVRWARDGTGKSGGVRVIYLTRNDAGEIYLLTLYAKSESENISLNTLKEIRRALES